MRKAHYLAHNKGHPWPRYVTFYDVESDTTPGPNHTLIFDLKLWVACHVEWRTDAPEASQRWTWGQTADVFWDDLEKLIFPKTRHYLVSHHVEPDFLPLDGFTQLRTRGWILGHVYKKGLTCILSFNQGTRKLIVLNNAQLIPGSINDVGKLVRVPKLSMPPPTAPNVDWIKYCRQDVKVMVEAWKHLKLFITTHNLGGFGLTRASLAKHAYCHRFMTHKIYVHNDGAATIAERLAYHGGRCQVLQHGAFTGDDFYLLDVTSMYGYIEATCHIPTRLVGWLDYPSLDKFARIRKRYGVIAQIHTNLAEPVLAHTVDKTTTYPTGAYSGVVTTPELDYILSHDWPVEIEYLLYYRLRPAFAKFATYFMALKSRYEQDHNPIMRQFAKDFPNSLYGKFGQWGSEAKEIGTCPPDLFRYSQGLDTVTGERYDLLEVGGKATKITPTLTAWDTFVAIPAHITAYGRMYLWHIMQQAGLANIYHVATDSLLVNGQGYHNLASWLQPGAPGGLRVVQHGLSLLVKAKNDWELDGIPKIKGVQPKASWLDENTVVNTNWPGILSWLKNDSNKPYYTQEVIKHLDRSEYLQALVRQSAERGLA